MSNGSFLVLTNFADSASVLQSEKHSISRLIGESNRNLASALASCVFPVPDGPTNRKDAIGRSWFLNT
jgi:hypothetical protein